MSWTMRYKTRFLLATVALLSVVLACYSKCQWYAGGFAESLAAELRLLPEVRSVQLRGYSDGPCHYALTDLIVQLHGEPNEERVVVFDLQPEKPISKFQMLGIGPYVLWTMGAEGHPVGRPDFGRTGAFSTLFKTTTATPVDVVKNYDLILQEIENLWPRASGESSVDDDVGNKVFFWAAPRPDEYTERWTLDEPV